MTEDTGERPPRAEGRRDGRAVQGQPGGEVEEGSEVTAAKGAEEVSLQGGRGRR